VGLSQPFGISQLQARDADVRALADLSRALDKKVSAHQGSLGYSLKLWAMENSFEAQSITALFQVSLQQNWF